MCDYVGNWKERPSSWEGTDDVFKAKVIAFWRGLQLVDMEGVNKIIIKFDCNNAVNAVKLLNSTNAIEDDEFVVLKWRICSLMRKFGHVSVCHVNHEANVVVDRLVFSSL
ncbi:hypothetical protein RJT34_09517 [Clitoria ternatea]|uniref:RNase H type-1 domain-containing protein n=1 Tax=Clitoria ternatea TaxID=43366 RepID=A0AAN9K5V0_CLITE